MDLKPGYKQTEAGVIPEDWDVNSLSTLCDSICDGTHFTPDYVANGIPFYSVENVTANDFSNVKFVSEEEHSRLIKRCKPERGDILMTRIGSLGDTKLLDWDVNASIYVSLALLRPSDRVNPKYLYCYSKSKAFVLDVEKRSLLNATPKKINMGDIGSIPIPVPRSLDEQQAIATALSDVDALIESLDRLITKKRQIKQGAMQELLTGKKRLPGCSGEWEVKLLGDLFDFSGGLSASREQLSTEGYCYLHYGDIHTSNKTFIDVKKEKQDIPKLNIHLKKVSSTSLLESGDVVFVDASEDDEGTSRHVVIFNEEKIPFISGLHTIVAKSKTNELDYYYRRYCFQINDIKQQFRFFAVGTKVSGISKTNIVKITLLVPPVEEQTSIAAILSDMDVEIAALEEKLEKSRRVKQGMMQELLTGRIRLVKPEIKA
jgi:type I restriction enzyme S subunit